MDKERIEEVRQYLGNCCWEPLKYKCRECGKELESDVELQENFIGIHRAVSVPIRWGEFGFCKKCWEEKKNEFESHYKETHPHYKNWEKIPLLITISLFGLTYPIHALCSGYIWFYYICILIYPVMPILFVFVFLNMWDKTYILFEKEMR